MENSKLKIMGSMLLLLIILGSVSAQGDFEGLETASRIGSRLGSILCAIVVILLMVAAGIAIIILIIQGIKWTGSADDPGARKQAKDAIVHAIIGLIIVVLAVEIISMVVAGMELISDCMYQVTGSI